MIFFRGQAWQNLPLLLEWQARCTQTTATSSMKSVRLRPRADTDIDALVDYLLSDSPDSAGRFLDAVQKSCDLIGEQPGIGSRRYAHPPKLEGLRMWAVSDFENHSI